MGTVQTKESELELSSRMLRSLAHRIRGDLSVITNDLTYLATLIEPGELERARARCARIATLLGTLDSLSVTDSKKALSPMSVLGLFRASGLLDNNDLRIKIVGSEVQLRAACGIMKELFGDWVAEGSWIAERSEVTIQIRCSRTTDVRGEYSSVSGFASHQLGERFVVEAGLVDLIARDHGWLVTIVSEEHCTSISLTIPAVMM